MSQPPTYPVEEGKQSGYPPTAAPYPTQAQPQPQQQQPYPQAGTVYYYPNQPQGYGPQQYVAGQPQQPVVVMAGGQSSQSFVGHIVFAGCSLCCCGIFGLVSLILAVLAQTQSRSEPQSARRMGNWSIGISVVNIIIGIIIWIIFVVYFSILVPALMFAALTEISQNSTNLDSLCKWRFEGTCYTYRYLSSGGGCTGEGYFNRIDKYCYYE